MKNLCRYFLAAAILGATPAARAQTLEAVGVASSFNISQTWARQEQIKLDAFTISTNIDRAREDDTGNRFGAYARIGFGEKGFFLQPELAYSKVLGNQYRIDDYSRPSPFGAWGIYYFSHWIRRTEVAALAGLKLGSKSYLLAGPVVALHRREQIEQNANYTFNELYSGLYGSVERVQALGQIGAGIQLWRFDLNARYERSLTPYTKQFAYQGQRYDYRQRTGQLILNAGFLIYDRHRPWRR